MSMEDSLKQAIRSPALKFIIVLALILILTVPLLFVYALVSERQGFADGAESQVAQMWARTQVVSGPYVVVPNVRTREVTRGDETRLEQIRRYAVFLPEDLDVKADVRSETRRRGIFEVPVYRSDVAVKGRFVAAEARAFLADGADMRWDDAVMVFLVSDVRGIRRGADVSIDGQAMPFRAGTGLAQATGAAIHVPLSQATAETGFSLDFKLQLNGSSALQFVPAGGDTNLAMQSDWPHPSFVGSFLPETRAISDAGFSARWAIPRLARGTGQVRDLKSIGQLASAKPFGVALFQPVKFYSLAERALKYAMGFIAVAFFAVFVMEIQSGLRVHWIQYIFVGLALVVFYVLLIGTAEHMGFDRGYAAAAVATAVLIGSYVGTVTSSAFRGVLLAAILALIYALLFLLLRLEDYALLVGSISAFVLIATVMFATRNVDWSTGARTRRIDGEAAAT